MRHVHVHVHAQREVACAVCAMLRQGAPKPPKPLPCQDYQFMDSIRLEELRQVEIRHYEYRKAIFDRADARLQTRRVSSRCC